MATQPDRKVTRITHIMTGASRAVDDMTLWHESEALCAEQHWAFDGELLKVAIRRHRHNDLSHCHVSIYSPKIRGWNHLCLEPLHKMPASAAAYQAPLRDLQTQTLMANTITKLVERAELLLGAVTRPDRVD